MIRQSSTWSSVVQISDWFSTATDQLDQQISVRLLFHETRDKHLGCKNEIKSCVSWFAEVQTEPSFKVPFAVHFNNYFTVSDKC